MTVDLNQCVPEQKVRFRNGTIGTYHSYDRWTVTEYKHDLLDADGKELSGHTDGGHWSASTINHALDVVEILPLDPEPTPAKDATPAVNLNQCKPRQLLEMSDGRIALYRWRAGENGHSIEIWSREGACTGYHGLTDSGEYCNGYHVVRILPAVFNPDAPASTTPKSPAHYGNTWAVGDFIRKQGLNFHLGNAVKYICRCEHKGSKAEDLRKAIHYLQNELDHTMETGE